MVPKQDKSDTAAARVPFTEADIREVARLLGLIAGRDKNEPQITTRDSMHKVDAIHPELLLARAKKHLRDRQLRKQYFSRAIFGEPAWDALIVLYISEFSGRQLTVGRLVDWIEAPLSTTQRWIAYLQKERLVTKESHPADKRMAYVRLLDKGRTILEEYLAALVE